MSCLGSKVLSEVNKANVGCEVMKVNLSYKDGWFGQFYLHVSIAELKFKCLKMLQSYILKSLKPKICSISTGTDRLVTMHFWRVGTNVYMVG